jgi:hypothetical protein
MRAIILGMVSLALACTEPALANTATAPVSVYLSVTPACKVQLPNTAALKPVVTAALKLPAGIVDTLPQIAVEMLVANCQTGVKPLLTLAGDGRTGAYLATIDF